MLDGHAGSDLVAACFLPRRKDASAAEGMRARADSTAGLLHATLEDLFVVHCDGLLLRHRLQVGPPPMVPMCFTVVLSCSAHHSCEVLSEGLVERCAQQEFWCLDFAQMDVGGRVKERVCLCSCLLHLLTWARKSWAPATARHLILFSGIPQFPAITHLAAFYLILSHRHRLSAHAKDDVSLTRDGVSERWAGGCSVEEGLGEVSVDAEEQWDLCRRMQWAERWAASDASTIQKLLMKQSGAVVAHFSRLFAHWHCTCIPCKFVQARVIPTLYLFLCFKEQGSPSRTCCTASEKLRGGCAGRRSW